MIKDGVIADTSVLIDFLKDTKPNADAVASLIATQRLYVTGIIMAELLQGVRSEKEEQYIGKLIDGIDAIELTNDLWLKAGRLSYSLRRKGISLPLTDIAIAAIALEHNLPIFTLDKHFESIPGISIYKP